MFQWVFCSSYKWTTCYNTYLLYQTFTLDYTILIYYSSLTITFSLENMWRKPNEITNKTHMARYVFNKNVNIKFSAYDAFLEKPASGMLKIERSESQIIWSFGSHKTKGINRTATIGTTCILVYLWANQPKIRHISDWSHNIWKLCRGFLT